MLTFGSAAAAGFIPAVKAYRSYKKELAIRPVERRPQ